MTPAHPSFARGLFAGAIHDALLFPYPPALNARAPGEAAVVRTLLGELERLRRDLIDSERMDAEAHIPDEVIAAFGEIGLLGLAIPKEYGGLGLSNTAYAKVFGAVASIDASLGVLVGVHCGLGSKAIVLYGNDEQKALYLPRLARGEILGAYALTEPETGSDAQNIVTTATMNADGSWSLNGSKIWIGLAHRAGVIATFAQTEIERRGQRVRRPTAFLLRPEFAGFEVMGTYAKLGIRGSTQAELRYTNLQVPADHVLGQVGKGFAVAVHVLNGGRLTLAAGCTAGAKALIGEMTRYGDARTQFGKPLNDFEITQRKVASLTADAYASDAMLGLLAAALDRQDEDCAIEAAICKIFASELIWRAADEMVQLAGGRGYVKPHPYERWLRDARINRIFEGANEILRLFISLNGVQGPAERLAEIGSALRAPIKNWGLVAGFAADRVKSVLGATQTLDVALHPRLGEHRKFFERHVSELQKAAEEAIMKFKKEIIHRQFVLERLAEMAIQLYSTAAVLARTQRLIEEQGLDQTSREVALCDVYCVEAGRRFRGARNALDAREESVDDTRRTIAAAVRAAEGYFVADVLLTDDQSPGFVRTTEERRFGGATIPVPPR